MTAPRCCTGSSVVCAAVVWFAVQLRAYALTACCHQFWCSPPLPPLATGYGEKLTQPRHWTSTAADLPSGTPPSLSNAGGTASPCQEQPQQAFVAQLPFATGMPPSAVSPNSVWRGLIRSGAHGNDGTPSSSSHSESSDAVDAPSSSSSSSCDTHGRHGGASDLYAAEVSSSDSDSDDGSVLPTAVVLPPPPSKRRVQYALPRQQQPPPVPPRSRRGTAGALPEVSVVVVVAIVVWEVLSAVVGGLPLAGVRTGQTGAWCPER